MQVKIFTALLIVFLFNRGLGFAYGLPAEYLSSFTASARAGGLGNAYTSAKGQACCSYWNPAGLCGIFCTQINIFSMPLFAGTQYLGMNFAFPLNEYNILGLNIIRLNSGYADSTDTTGNDTGYNFNDSQSAYSLTYCHAVHENMSFGINLKFLYQNINTYSAEGSGLDIGLLQNITENITYGIALQNIFPAKLGTETINTNMRAGISMSIPERKLLLAADLYSIDPFNKNYIYWCTGLEYNFSETFALRIGNNSRNLSIGFGFISKKINLDFAYGFHPLNPVQMVNVTLSYDFTVSREEMEINKKYSELKKYKKETADTISAEKENISREKESIKLESWIAAKLVTAKACIEKKEYGKATAILKEITGRKPGNEEAGAMLGEIYRVTGKENTEKRFIYAKDFYAKKDYSKTVEETKIILSIEPGHQRALALGRLAQSQLYISEKKYTEAKNELVELLKADPENIEATSLVKRVQTMIEIMNEK